jgi:hypothetical protein
MRPNGGRVAAKPRQEIRVFDRTSSKLNYLHVMFGKLAACGSVATNQGQTRGTAVSDLNGMRQHLAFSRRRDGRQHFAALTGTTN